MSKSGEEPLKADRPNATSALAPNHTLETENDRVRIYRIKLAIGESLASHVHETGRVEVTVSGPEGPGASRWVAGGVNHSLQATAGSPAVEVVEIEPK